VIRGNNLTKGEIPFIDSGFVYITEEKARELSNCTALPGDLVFTQWGTLGQVGLIPECPRFSKYVISNKQIRARVDTNQVFPRYLYYWFSQSWVQNLIVRRQRGSSIPGINLGILKSLPIAVPPITEQEQIVSAIEATDAKRASEESRKASLDVLFRTLLHDLMNGKLHVQAEWIKQAG
jgi:type I restriction enzyme S subunit